MRQQGLQPNVITYNSVISACEKGGKAESALQLFYEMRQQGLQPNVIFYTAVISACGKGGKAERALQLFCEMRQQDQATSLRLAE